MAVVDITEYAELSAAGRGNLIMAGQEPSIRNQQVGIGGTSVQSQPMGDVTRFVRIHAEAPCRVSLGDNPTASSASMRMVAGGTEYLGVVPGLKIAVIASA